MSSDICSPLLNHSVCMWRHPTDTLEHDTFLHFGLKELAFSLQMDVGFHPAGWRDRQTDRQTEGEGGGEREWASADAVLISPEKQDQRGSG